MIKKSIKTGLETAGLFQLHVKFRRFLKQQKILLTYHPKGDEGWPLVSPEAFSESCALAIKTLNTGDYVFGDYLEFGVSFGTSLSCMHQALWDAGLPDVRLIGFDSFEGMIAESKDECWAPGSFSSTIEQTRCYLKRSGVNLGKVELVKGWYKDTCTQETIQRLNLRRASIIMIACDIYTGSCEALSFCEPLLADRSVIIFDDWGCRSDVGEIGPQEAFQEFLTARPELTAEPLPAHTDRARMFLVTRRQ